MVNPRDVAGERRRRGKCSETEGGMWLDRKRSVV